jgi:hypothetical protein
MGVATQFLGRWDYTSVSIFPSSSPCTFAGQGGNPCPCCPSLAMWLFHMQKWSNGRLSQQIDKQIGTWLKHVTSKEIKQQVENLQFSLRI